MSEFPPTPPPPGPPPPPLPGAQPVGPVSAAERLETLDALRGFALFGILLVNMALFSWPLYKVMMGGADWQGVDALADLVVRTLAEGKFYPLFSLLFGVGAAIQMDRAEARGTAFAGAYTRRLLVLLGIGVLHAFLVWEGDILVLYAVTGFLLIPFRQCRPRTLLIWAAVAIALPALACGAIALLMGLGSLVPEVDRILSAEFARQAAHNNEMTAHNLEVFANGSFGAIFVARAQNVLTLYSVAWFMAPLVLGMFLLGTYAWRRGVFLDVEGHRGFILKVTIVGAFVGLPLNVLYGWLWMRSGGDGYGLGHLVAATVVSVGGPALGLAYAGTLTLMLRRTFWQRALRPVAAAGRMGLTNYLLQSVVCTTIFYSYGLGYYGAVGRAGGLLLALCLYAAQLALSVWWLKHYRFGPAEWVWRSLTYGRKQPMRR